MMPQKAAVFFPSKFCDTRFQQIRCLVSWSNMMIMKQPAICYIAILKRLSAAHHRARQNIINFHIPSAIR